jgi:hypothetical protein
MFLFLRANKDLWENPVVMRNFIDQFKVANNGVDDAEDDKA